MSHSLFRSVLVFYYLLFFNSSSLCYEDVSFVASGSFQMGSESGHLDESPRHEVWVSGFYIDRFEVTIREWNLVKSFATSNGYKFGESQENPKKGPSWYQGADRLDFPMNKITWFDAIKWCNARSQFMGRLPVYYDLESNEVIMQQELNSSSAIGVFWNRSGYRLPTEAEWEKAARGYAAGYKFPWGNKIDGSMANYKLSGDPFDNGSTPVGYFSGNQEIVNRLNSNGGEKVNPFPNKKNLFNLYDVVGNVSEWCWNWYDEEWYRNSKNTKRDDRGPKLDDLSKDALTKVHRGGGYYNDNSSEGGESLRISFRHIEFPDGYSSDIGIRSVRGNFDDPLWSDAVETNLKGWFSLSWLGSYYKTRKGWTYFSRLNWVFPSGHGSYDNWLYFYRFDRWLWTSKFVYPWFYDDKEENWFLLSTYNLNEIKFLSATSSSEILPVK